MLRHLSLLRGTFEVLHPGHRARPTDIFADAIVLDVLDVEDGRIAWIFSFGTPLLDGFHLPESLP